MGLDRIAVVCCMLTFRFWGYFIIPEYFSNKNMQGTHESYTNLNIFHWGFCICNIDLFTNINFTLSPRAGHHLHRCATSIIPSTVLGSFLRYFTSQAPFLGKTDNAPTQLRDAVIKMTFIMCCSHCRERWSNLKRFVERGEDAVCV